MKANVKTDYKTGDIIFFDSENSITIDRNMFAEIIIEKCDTQAIIDILKQKGFRVLKQKFGMFTEKWVDV